MKITPYIRIQKLQAKTTFPKFTYPSANLPPAHQTSNVLVLVLGSAFARGQTTTQL